MINGLIAMFGDHQLIASDLLKDIVIATSVTSGVVGEAVALPIQNGIEITMMRALMMVEVGNANGARPDTVIQLFAPRAEILAWTNATLGDGDDDTDDDAAIQKLVEP